MRDFFAVQGGHGPMINTPMAVIFGVHLLVV